MDVEMDDGGGGDGLREYTGAVVMELSSRNRLGPGLAVLIPTGLML